MTSYSLSNQVNQMPTNVQIANPNQVGMQQNEDPKVTLVRSVLRSITGLKDIMPEKANEVYKIFKYYELDVLKDACELAKDRYDDPFNKYPSKTFWRTCVQDTMRSWRLSGKIKREEVYKPTEKEKEKVARMARETAMMFAKANGEELEKPKSMYQQKVDRYKENAELGNVLIRDPENPLDGSWIPREEAEANDYLFRCPVKWLEDQSKKKRINNM